MSKYSASKWPGCVQCLLCKDVIVSNTRHDFVYCECKNTFVDGGYDYLRYGSEGVDGLKNVQVLRLSKMPKRKKK